MLWEERVRGEGERGQLRAELDAARRRIAELTARLEAPADAGPHRQADGAPLTSHQLFEGLFESGHVLAAILDPELRFVRVNHAFAARAGREPAAFVGHGCFELCPDPEAEAAFRRVAQTGEPPAGPGRPLRFSAGPDGPVTYWDWTLTPHKGPDGAVVRLTLLLVDATERTRAAETLAASEARYRGLAEAMPVGVFRADPAGEWVYANARMGQKSGRAPADFLGNRWIDCLHPEDRGWVTGLWRRAVEAGGPFSAECRLTRAGGEVMWVFVQALPEPTSDGFPGGYLGSVTDVTRQRGARETLNALAASSGNDLDAFLRDCVRQLANAYGSRYALVGLKAGPRVETHAVWAGDDFAPDFTYDLEGFPCKELLKGGQVLMSEGVCTSYPDNDLLRDLEVESYLGHPLVDAAGRVVGVAVVMDVRPMTLSPWTEPILGSFARRIAAEVERHRAEERLARSEHALARAQQIAHLGHWEWDMASGAVSWSEETYRILGLSPQTGGASYEAFLATVYPDDRTYVKAELEAAVDPARRKPYAIDHRVVLPGGEVRTVHKEGEVTFDPVTGRALRMIGTVHDITAQYRAQEALEALATHSATNLDGFLRESARHLAQAYGTRHGFVGLLTGETPEQVRTLAWWAGDRFVDNVTYGLADTPCADIVSGRLTQVPEGVAARYPDDPFLTEFGIESYFGSPLVGSDGRVIGLVAVLDVRPLRVPTWTEPILGGFARRISAELERSRAQAGVEQSEQELSAILDNLQDVYCRTDLDGRIMRLSPSMAELLGYRPDELIGDRIADLYTDPDGRARFLADLEAAGGRIRSREVRLRARDGRTVWLSLNGQYVRDGEGRVVGVEGTGRDVTETRHMAAALQESEARLAEAQAIAHLGSWEWTPAGALACSEETFRILGLAPETAGEAPEDGGTLPLARFLDAVHPDDRERVERAFRAALDDGLPLREDHRVVRPDGTVRVVRQIAMARTGPAGRGGVVGAMQDVTELARAEADRERFHAQLLQSQKMEAVGLLAGGVAHDFNNLLTTITGYTDLALTRLSGDGPLYDDLAEVRLAAERAASVTRQLLLFSRRQPMAFAPVDLGRRLEPLLRMLRRVIGEDVEIVTDIAADAWPALADGMSVDQMLMNLAINARDAMPDGGRLTIRIANVLVPEGGDRAHPEAVPGRFVRVTVSDTGTGMDEETLARIFEPFFTTKEPGRGTGLGMSVAHGIAKQHGGWIQAESLPGRGTSFHVHLPAAREARADAPAPAVPAPARGEGRRVLVVEDEEALRAFARTALAGQGYRVIAAGTAREALEVFEREAGAFDLVFSDVVLPDRSGLKLVDELRARRPNVRVLLSSGYPDPQAGWSVIEEKGLPFIQKPYSLVTLLTAVARGVEGEAAAPAP